MRHVREAKRGVKGSSKKNYQNKRGLTLSCLVLVVIFLSHSSAFMFSLLLLPLPLCLFSYLRLCIFVSLCFYLCVFVTVSLCHCCSVCFLSYVCVALSLCVSVSLLVHALYLFIVPNKGTDAQCTRWSPESYIWCWCKEKGERIEISLQIQLQCEALANFRVFACVSWSLCLCLSHFVFAS